MCLISIFFNSVNIPFWKYRLGFLKHMSLLRSFTNYLNFHKNERVKFTCYGASIFLKFENIPFGKYRLGPPVSPSTCRFWDRGLVVCTADSRSVTRCFMPKVVGCFRILISSDSPPTQNVDRVLRSYKLHYHPRKLQNMPSQVSIFEWN